MARNTGLGSRAATLISRRFLIAKTLPLNKRMDYDKPIVPTMAAKRPTTAQDGQSGTRTPPGKPGASEGDE